MLACLASVFRTCAGYTLYLWAIFQSSAWRKRPDLCPFMVSGLQPDWLAEPYFNFGYTSIAAASFISALSDLQSES